MNAERRNRRMLYARARLACRRARPLILDGVCVRVDARAAHSRCGGAPANRL